MCRHEQVVKACLHWMEGQGLLFVATLILSFAFVNCLISSNYMDLMSLALRHTGTCPSSPHSIPYPKILLA